MSIENIRNDFENELNNCSTLAEVDVVRIKYRGQKGIITLLSRTIKDQPKEERGTFGKNINILKNAADKLLSDKLEELKKVELENQVEAEWMDPSINMKSDKGHLHPLSEIQNKIEDDIIIDFENSFTNLEVLNYEIKNKNEIDKPTIETFEILIDHQENNSNLYLNPFFDESFKTNPFKQQNRLYPVDFGYPRKYIVNFTLELPDNFIIDSYPKSKLISLEKEGIKYLLTTRKHQNFKINLKSSFLINKTIFHNFEYQALKELFNQTITSQKQPIVLKRI